MKPFRAAALPLWIGLLAMLLYARAAGNGFALDDRFDLVENRFVTGPLDLKAIFGSEYYGGWGHLATGHYRPLLNLTYRSIAAAFGLTPAPFHVLNVLVFGLLVALTVHLVSRLAGSVRTGAVAGLTFAAHPVNSESVAAIVGLKELASAGLGMLAVWLYVRGREASGFADGRGSAPRPLLAFAALLAALLYKESAFAFVPIALAAEFLHVGAPKPANTTAVLRRAARIWPLAAALVVATAARVLVTGGLFRPTSIQSVDNPLVLLAEPFRRLAAAGLLGRVLALFAWPACLSSDYAESSIPLPASAADPWIVVSVAAAVGLAIGFAWSVRCGHRVVAFGLASFALAYLPVSNVIVLIGTNMAERLYLVPVWGLSIAVAGVLIACHDRFLPEGNQRHVVAALVFAALVVPLAARTWVRIGDWKDNATLAASAHRCHPRNVKVLVVLAEIEAARGRHDRALELYDEALAVRPASSYVQAAMGSYLLDRGETERGIAMLEGSIVGGEPITGPLLRLAFLYLERNREDDALRVAKRALEVGPSFAEAATAHLVFGEVGLRRKDLDAAAREYRLAIGENPKEPAAYFNLGRILEAQGRLEEALDFQLRAESLAPRDGRVLYARAVVEAKLGRLDASLETIERLRAQHPDFAPARDHRARLLILLGDKAAAAGDPAGARRRYESALEAVGSGPLAEEARRRSAALSQSQ